MELSTEAISEEPVSATADDAASAVLVQSAGTMCLADLIQDLKASLNDASTVFTAADDADFKRHLNGAALAFQRKRPRTHYGSLTLVADLAQYAAPADFVSFKSHLWGIAPKRAPRPWEQTWPGRLPDVRLVDAGATTIVRKLQLDPAPQAFQISALGAEFRFYYYAAHVLGAAPAETSIVDADRGLLILRAQAEAMRELAFRGSKKPVQLRDGLSGTPRNATPTYLFEALLAEFQEAA
jgi:hypothetical protein